MPWQAVSSDVISRLSAFDANDSGSLINRVTADVQRVRMFVEMVVMQSVIVLLTITVAAIYMLRVHAGLALACLATTPLMWVVIVQYSRAVKPAYRPDRLCGLAATVQRAGAKCRKHCGQHAGVARGRGARLWHSR